MPTGDSRLVIVFSPSSLQFMLTASPSPQKHTRPLTAVWAEGEELTPPGVGHGRCSLQRCPEELEYSPTINSKGKMFLGGVISARPEEYRKYLPVKSRMKDKTERTPCSFRKHLSVIHIPPIEVMPF